MGSGSRSGSDSSEHIVYVTLVASLATAGHMRAVVLGRVVASSRSRVEPDQPRRTQSGEKDPNIQPWSGPLGVPTPIIHFTMCAV